MSKNSKLFSLGPAISVNMETGEETVVEGSGLRMLPGPPGTCEWCHVEHEQHMPHNRDSMAYRIKFGHLNGRDPTWTDAMAHCSPEIKKATRESLIEVMNEHGLEIPEDLRE